MVEEEYLSEARMKFIKTKGVERAIRLAIGVNKKEYRQAVRKQVLRGFELIKSVSETNPELLAKWMKPDPEGSIMVYPGTPVDEGYAINGMRIEYVPSMLGVDKGKREVEPEKLGRTFEFIVEYLAKNWDTLVPKLPNNSK